jgi:BirA family transcriptional regulator, biotin operon repressor / biotin---[acetyl-CoA-carboxylase] ligase
MACDIDSFRGGEEPVLTALRARHEHVDSIGSTNAELMRRAAAGETGPFWLTATQQLSGRGRADRQWSSPPGNLYASLLLTDPCPMAFAPGLGFVAGVALVEAISVVAPNLAGVALKWPNDLLINGAKVAGVLPEAAHHGGALAVVVGMGINCAFYPQNTPYPATSLAAQGAPMEPQSLFKALARSFESVLQLFDEGRGQASVLQRWRQHAHGMGAEVTVKPPSGPVTGVFEAIDGDGALILRQGIAKIRITAGDVYFSTVPRQEPRLIQD